MNDHQFNGFTYKSNEKDNTLPLIQIDGKKDKPVFPRSCANPFAFVNIY